MLLCCLLYKYNKYTVKILAKNGILFNAKNPINYILGSHKQKHVCQQKHNDLLQCACSRGAIDVANYAISLGAKVQNTDAAGDAPLALASRAGHTALVEMLLKKGAYIDAVNKVGTNCQ